MKCSWPRSILIEIFQIFPPYRSRATDWWKPPGTHWDFSKILSLSRSSSIRPETESKFDKFERLYETIWVCLHEFTNQRLLCRSLVSKKLLTSLPFSKVFRAVSFIFFVKLVRQFPYISTSWPPLVTDSAKSQPCNPYCHHIVVHCLLLGTGTGTASLTYS